MLDSTKGTFRQLQPYEYITKTPKIQPTPKNSHSNIIIVPTLPFFIKSAMPIMIPSKSQIVTLPRIPKKTLMPFELQPVITFNPDSLLNLEPIYTDKFVILGFIIN